MEIRTLDPADAPAAFDLRSRAFGPLPPDRVASRVERIAAAIPAGRELGCYEGTRLVATARIHDHRQWWHGRDLAMAGIAGVAVAPEERGRGVGRLLMRTVLARCAELGSPLSVLYPATTPLYRSLGWEHAGGSYQLRFPAEALRALAGPPVALRRAGPADAAEVREVLRRVHAARRDSGPLDPGEDNTRDRIAVGGYSYLAHDGYLDYDWGEGNRSLHIDTLVAASADTARALWAAVGSGASVVDTVTAIADPRDAVTWLAREPRSELIENYRWMLRLVDAPAAVSGRGYPATAAVETRLHLADEQLPANAGDWTLRIAGGKGELVRAHGPAPADPPRLGIGALAALYAGVPTATLRACELMTGGDPATDDALDAAFHAQPFTLHRF
ncbi:GNAT family N-acetyltransferase [Allonocardiopsis opalescens]|uniref:Putative acetyltransferase n=1 Tax=Allonocardiopsis opalescens TaxID=1144618 RepID=A0A2T0PTY3_9ACTN|nr:GNAT family N-acetyltransferase [Allonocardiopsis opalescens]PRX92360.1 putative acetyltransferase [Allonocardiopsis opalescens]